MPTKEDKLVIKLKVLSLEEEQGMLMIRSRAATDLLELLNAEYLPVLMSSMRIAVLDILKSQRDCDHKSVDITL